MYPTPHLYHILFELLKNYMQATVEIHDKSHKLPMIEVLVAKGERDVSIRVSDQVSPSYTLGTDILCAGWRVEVSPAISQTICSIHDTNQGTPGWL